MHNEDWDDLRFFLALCRAGSITGPDISRSTDVQEKRGSVI